MHWHRGTPVKITTAFAALLVAACSSPAEPTWSVALDGDDLDRLALSVWGTSSDNVYVAGGGLGNGLGALALRYDGAAWAELDTGSDDTLWWVWGPSSEETYFVGEAGAVVHIDGTGAAAIQATPTTHTLYGVWGAAADDIWAVGGDPLASEPTAVILHYDGQAWVDATPDATVVGALFKVWGAAADDVWAVGQNGTLLHHDGSDWRAVDAGTQASLFTVTGTAAGDVWAVGGPPATILHYDGSAWNTVDSGVPSSLWNGVSAAAGEVLVAGMNGAKVRYDGATWIDETDAGPFIDLHAAWIAPDGAGYVVGGNLFAPGTPGVDRIGVVAYYGTDPPPDSL